MANYDIAAFVWPSYTGDELRSRIFWPEGIGEWQTVKKAGPKFDGHNWPRRPLWGYVNEADSSVMEMQIEEAVNHGVNVFIYDWYWYDRRPFLENCLNDGFLKAKNNSKMKFYIMWANHDANHLWDKRLSDSECRSVPVWQGTVDRAEFERMAERLIDKYFSCDNYYKINGEPVFMIYELHKFVEGLGGVDEAADAIKWFKKTAKDKGCTGVHIQIAGRASNHNLSGVDGHRDNIETIKKIGIDSFTHYQFVHITNVNRSYPEVMEDVKTIWGRAEESYGIPYYPHVSCGWDNNPRFDSFLPNILKDNTPKNFESAIRDAKKYIDERNLPVSLITINSWNEWTESSYLEPDDLYGYGYLDAIKKVFVDNK